MILGEEFGDMESDDFLYTRDLGLIRVLDDSTVTPANPIYAEIIVRRLSSIVQTKISKPEYPYKIPHYLKDGQIDMDYLMNDFQKFWHEHGDDWAKQLDYVEAAPHLTMMGFLQRIVNGGGQIVREMASGSGRLDICVIYEGQKYPIELKIRYGDKYLEKGLEQTARYMDIHCCNEGWMVVFDRRKSIKWEDKLYMKKEIVDGKTITVVGV
jgi:hypothetical protein